MSSNIDTNVSNYSTAELMAISDITTLTAQEITEKTNALINKHKSNSVLALFFTDIQTYLLQQVNSSNDAKKQEGYANMNNLQAAGAIFGDGDEQIRDWYQNEALSQLASNTPTEE